MSRTTRICLLILNIICIPVNIHTIYQGMVRYAQGQTGSAVGQMALATFALVWCSLVVYSYSKILLKDNNNSI